MIQVRTQTRLIVETPNAPGTGWIMDLSAPSLVPLSQILCLTVAVAAGFAAALMHRQRQRATAGAMHRGAVDHGKIIYHDAPTVRVTDSQRVDRVRKVVRLAIGTSFDVLESHPGLEPRFRLTLESLDQEGEQEAARIRVEYGGVHLSCGPLVEELGHNYFVLPRALREESRSSVFHYQEHGGALDFMRLRLRSIDAAAGTADLDVLQVSGRW